MANKETWRGIPGQWGFYHRDADSGRSGWFKVFRPDETPDYSCWSSAISYGAPDRTAPIFQHPRRVS